jgi:hypothetical protein
MDSTSSGSVKWRALVNINVTFVTIQTTHFTENSTAVLNTAGWTHL